MIKELITVIAIALTTSVFAQTPFNIFSDDFESSSSSWTTSGSNTPNSWIFGSCAGNGLVAAGSHSLYISSGPANGIIPGCASTGIEEFIFSNAPIANVNTIISTQVDAQCLTSVVVDFEYQFAGATADDYCELVYSLDNGTSWIPLGSPLPATISWTPQTINLPAPVAGNIIDLGFRFTYNDNTIAGTPFAVDNISVSATDMVPPAIICPAEIPAHVDNTCSAVLGDYTALVTPTDNCLNALTVTQSPIAGTVLNLSNNPTVTLTVTDASGNQGQCSFTQSVIDTISPAINCPVHQVINLDANCTAIVPDYITGLVATDNCESFSTPTLTQSPPAGSTIGATTVITITTTDGSGNTGQCDFNLITADVTAPTITCPGPITVSTDTLCDFEMIDYTGLGIAVDNCTSAPAMTYSQSPAIGTLVPTGTNIVTLTVLDGSAISGTCTFDLIVEDQVNPVIVMCPPNQDVIVDATCGGTLGDYTTILAATDNCTTSGNLVVTQVPSSGTAITSNTLVTLTVTDEIGNSSNCQFTALLSDTTPPSVNCPADFNLAMNSSCQYTVPDITGMVTGSDNCSVFGNMTLTQSPAPGATGSGTTNILITLFDEQGNINTCITEITPDDISAPTITCPGPTTINNGISCDYILPNYGTVTTVLDDCPDYSLVQTPAVGSLVNPGITLITIEVIDAGGNTASCSFPLTVIETEAPTINCPNSISTCDPLVTYATPTFSDNCFATLSQIDLSGLTSGDTFPVGNTPQEYMVIDSSGNMNTCIFQIEILEYPSQALITEDTISLCDINTTVISADPVNTGTGEWTIESGAGTFNNQFANSTGINSLAIGENVIVWTITTVSCGNSSDTLIINVLEEELPASIVSDTIYACELGSVSLNANNPVSGYGIWTTDGNSNITLPTAASTIVIIPEAGINQYNWTVYNSTCPVTTDSVIVITNRKPSLNYGDSELCFGSSDLVIPIDSSDYDANWSFNIGNGNIDTSSDTSALITNLSSGTNQILMTSSMPGCIDLADTVELLVKVCDDYTPEIPTMFTPNFDGKNDLFVIDNIEELYPDCHVVIFNRWGAILYESTGYQIPWDGTNKGEKLPMGTYFYKIELNDSEGTILNGDISIIH